MSSRVVGLCDVVGTLGYDLSILHYDSAKRPSAVADTLFTQPYGTAHKIFLIHIHDL